MQNLIYKLSFLLISIVLFTGCFINNSDKNLDSESIDFVADHDSLIEVKQSIVRDDLEYLHARLIMGSGRLNIKSTEDKLLDASFFYNVKIWKPEVELKEEGSEGKLIIRQPNRNDHEYEGKAKYRWDLGFNNEIPLDLKIQFGAGTGKFKLGDLNLKELKLELGAGEAFVDLRKNKSLEEMNLVMGMGKVEVDLRGEFKNDVTIKLKGGLGALSVKLPTDIGVKLEVKKGFGTFDIEGLEKDGNKTWKNQLFGQTENSIHLEITSGMGSITVDAE